MSLSNRMLHMDPLPPARSKLANATGYPLHPLLSCGRETPPCDHLHPLPTRNNRQPPAPHVPARSVCAGRTNCSVMTGTVQ